MLTFNTFVSEINYFKVCAYRIPSIQRPTQTGRSTLDCRSRSTSRRVSARIYHPG